MRHTFGTNAFESGFDIREVQELMGHADIGSTLGYVEVSKKRLRDKAKEMKVFSGAR
jgi:integrase/recombinase XerD